MISTPRQKMDLEHRDLSLFNGGIDTNTFEYLSWRRLHLSKSKLSNVAEMASFMAGFAVVATVELQINDDGHSPILLTAFVVVTALLVATSMLVILISTCILPQLDAVTKTVKCPSEEVNRSPHDSLIGYIDLSWILANTVSLFLFTLDVILLCWIKYTHFSLTASIVATAIMSPVLVVILIFGVLFYRKIIKHQYDIFSKKYHDLEIMQRTLQLHIEHLSMSGDLDDVASGVETLDFYEHAGFSPLTSVPSSPGHVSPRGHGGQTSNLSAFRTYEYTMYQV